MHDALPYLVPDDTVVTFGPWTTHDADEPVSETWEGWDAETDIRLERIARIEMGLLRAQTGLPVDVPLRMTASWESSTTRMRLPAGAVPVLGDGENRLCAVLPGSRVSGSVTLRTTLALARDWDAPPGVAARAGSVLRTDERRLVLQSDAPMFPIEVVDFASTTWDPMATWHLTVSSDLDAPFLGACWLSLNSRDRELIRAVSSEKPNLRQEALLETLYGGVAELLLELSEIWARDEDNAHRAYPIESLGEVLAQYASTQGPVGPSPATTMVDAAARATFRQGTARRMGMGRRLR